MSWHDIPNFPGYQINRRGTVRKNTGYVLSRKGAGYQLWRAGQREWVSVTALLAQVFTPDGDLRGMEPARDEVVNTSASAREEFTSLPGYPGFEINRAGAVRDAQGNLQFLYSKGAENVPYYRLPGHARRVNGLLYTVFGSGAASAAGYPEPNPKQMAAARKPRLRREEVSSATPRRCHDCGRPTANYRCDACWRKMRGYGQDGATERASGTLWDEC